MSQNSMPQNARCGDPCRCLASLQSERRPCRISKSSAARARNHRPPELALDPPAAAAGARIGCRLRAAADPQPDERGPGGARRQSCGEAAGAAPGSYRDLGQPQRLPMAGATGRRWRGAGILAGTGSERAGDERAPGAGARNGHAGGSGVPRDRAEAAAGSCLAQAADTSGRILVECLAWLDRHWDDIRTELPPTRIAIFDLGLFCLLEHLPFRSPINLSSMLRLTAFAAVFAARPSAQATPYLFDTPPPEAATQR